MGKKDSAYGKTGKVAEAFSQKPGIGAVLVRKEPQVMGSQVDEGVSHNQRSGGLVKVSRFPTACTWKGDRGEIGWLVRHASSLPGAEILTVPIMILVGSDNLDGGGW